MRGILADHNIVGHLEAVMSIIKHDGWLETWSSLGLTVFNLEDLGLNPRSSDKFIWDACQAGELVLFTANRNHDGPDSLEAAIRNGNDETCLPVFTLANEDRFLKSREYASRVVENFLEYLLDIEKYRGTGRLYLPRSA